MTPRQLLSPQSRATLFDPPTDPAAIVRHYTLSLEDLALIRQRRRAANRLGFAVHLAYLRFPGRAIGVAENSPPDMLCFVAEQIEARADDFQDYAGRLQTRRAHLGELQGYLGVRPFRREDYRAVARVAVEEATGTDRGDAIVSAIIDSLRERRILLPASVTLEKMGLAARARARKRAHKNLVEGLGHETIAGREALIAVSDDKDRTPLAWLRDWPEAPTQKNLLGIVERLQVIRKLGVKQDREQRIHRTRYAAIARETAILSAQHLSRLDAQRQLATLVGFAREMEAILTDAAITMFDKMLGGVFRRADRAHKENVVDRAKALDSSTRALLGMAKAMLAAKASGGDQIAAVERSLGWERLKTLVAEADKIVTAAREDNLSEVVERYPTVRRVVPVVLGAFVFRSWKSGDSLLAALDVLRGVYATGARSLPPRPPTAFLKSTWRKLVGSGAAVDRRAYEVAVMMTLRDRLRSGDVWVEGCRAYQAFDDFLLPPETFVTRRRDNELGLAVPDRFDDWRAERIALLESRVRQIDAMAAAGNLPEATLTEEGLSISPIRKAGLIADAAGNLFGTTAYGGALNDGVVFELAERPLYRAEMVIWQFAGRLDGGRPETNLTFDSNGNLYGTTAHGGAYGGLGTVFKVAASGNSSFPLYSFGSAINGAQPYGNLIVDLAGNLYGTTYGKGLYDGTVFKIAPNGAMTMLYTFQYKDTGALPLAGLTADSNGNLYGTTSISGASGSGTVFELTGTGFLAKPVPYSAFLTELAIDLAQHRDADTFNLTALFTLGQTSPGIDPAANKVSLTVGAFSTTLAAGSLKPNGSGAYQFTGTVNGVALQVHLTPTGQQNYSLTAAASNANPSGTSNPVSVTLAIGANTGTRSTTASIQRQTERRESANTPNSLER